MIQEKGKLVHRASGACQRSGVFAPGERSVSTLRCIRIGRAERVNAPVCSHRAPFAELIDHFPSYTKAETGVIKAIVEVE